MRVTDRQPSGSLLTETLAQAPHGPDGQREPLRDCRQRQPLLTQQHNLLSQRGGHSTGHSEPFGCLTGDTS
jgi:hypothetical protein